jgi:hypothetical protein
VPHTADSWGRPEDSFAVTEAPAPRDRGRDSSRALTEVRTVFNRARTSLDMLQLGLLRGADNTPDPDEREMAEALEQVAALLERWQRTGRNRSHRYAKEDS